MRSLLILRMQVLVKESAIRVLSDGHLLDFAPPVGGVANIDGSLLFLLAVKGLSVRLDAPAKPVNTFLCGNLPG